MSEKFSNWVQNLLGLWVPGDGARLAIVQGGASKAAETGQAAGTIPYIDDDGVLAAPTVQADALHLTGGAGYTGDGNLLQEASGEYGLATWKTGGNNPPIAVFTEQYGGAYLEWTSDGEAYTACQVYNPSSFQDYYLTFYVAKLSSGAGAQYRVELWNDANSSNQGTIVDWTDITSTGFHAVDLSQGSWPSSPTNPSHLRVLFRVTNTFKEFFLRQVAIVPNSPAIADQARANRAWYQYHRQHMPHNHAWLSETHDTPDTVADWLAIWRLTIPKGHRTVIGRVRWYGLSDADVSNVTWKLRDDDEKLIWTFPSTEGEQNVNQARSQVYASDANDKLAIMLSNNSGATMYMIGGGSSVSVSLFVVPW